MIRIVGAIFTGMIHDSRPVPRSSKKSKRRRVSFEGSRAVIYSKWKMFPYLVPTVISSLLWPSYSSAFMIVSPSARVPSGRSKEHRYGPRRWMIRLDEADRSTPRALAGGLDTHRASYRGDRSESSTSTDIGSGITRAGRKRGKGDSDGIGSCRPMSVPRLSLAAGQDGAETSGSSGESGSDTSSITSLQDVLGLEGFADLSDGRNTCLKRVDQPGDESEGNPAKGSKVKVHYRMRLLGGAELATSGEDTNKPFEFRLGRWPSEATHGWDKAISTMHKGEVVTLVCGPQYAFGQAGAPPKIPANATVETKLELVDWLDLAATYNAVPGKVETDSELKTRWGKEIADGTSPMKAEAGIERRVQAAAEAKDKTTPVDKDHRNRKIYDVKSDEAKKILAKQKIQGYTSDFGYVEKMNYFDLYIPVPKGTRAKDVRCEIHPDRMRVEVAGTGLITAGRFEGKVVLDGCYWLMTDLSLDTPGTTAHTKDKDIRQGPRDQGETCVQVFLEKRKPFDTLWENIFVADDELDADGEEAEQEAV